jgi:hypothetical protein
MHVFVERFQLRQEFFDNGGDVVISLSASGVHMVSPLPSVATRAGSFGRRAIKFLRSFLGGLFLHQAIQRFTLYLSSAA